MNIIPPETVFVKAVFAIFKQNTNNFRFGIAKFANPICKKAKICRKIENLYKTS